jgi:hypothetical protein
VKVPFAVKAWDVWPSSDKATESPAASPEMVPPMSYMTRTGEVSPSASGPCGCVSGASVSVVCVESAAASALPSFGVVASDEPSKDPSPAGESDAASTPSPGGVGMPTQALLPRAATSEIRPVAYAARSTQRTRQI